MTDRAQKGPVLRVESHPDGRKAFLHKYGVVLNAPLITHNAPPGAEDLYLEFYCFKTGRTIEQGGLGRYGHLRKITAILLPRLIWNPWLEEQIKCLCDDSYAIRYGDAIQKYIAWAGCGAAGKTFAVALFAFIWFLADPLESIVVLTSTSAKMVRRRIWPVLSGFYVQVRDALGTPGHLVDSKTTIQAVRGNDKNAIFAMAVGEGETAKAAANIQGMHAKRILVLIDEATDVQEAILIAIENLKKGCLEIIIVFVGNAKSRLDPLGREMEPKDGWNSITVEDDEWLTKRGICLHFDGFQSPNVKAKKTLWPFIFTYEDYQDAIQNGDPKDIAFWMYVRGFPPPDGVQNTVFSEPMIDQYDGRGQFVFITKRRTVAGLDPGFGGDKCVLRFAYYGDLEDGKMAVQLGERIVINGDATSKHSLDYQIAARTVEECKKRGMGPNELGVDSTGIGRGVYSHIVEMWGSDVVSVEFGGSASDMPASMEDSRPGREVYGNSVTELHFDTRLFLESGQLRGLTTEVIKDFCTREYEYRSRKVHLETKEKCKKRLGHSPDDGDSVVIIIRVVRRLGATAQSKGKARNEVDWDRAARKLDSVHYEEEQSTTAMQPMEFNAWMQ